MQNKWHAWTGFTISANQGYKVGGKLSDSNLSKISNPDSDFLNVRFFDIKEMKLGC